MDYVLSTLTTRFLSASRTLCKRDWAGGQTFNNAFARLYWIDSGEGVVYHHRRKFPLRPGRLFVIPAHTPSRYFSFGAMDLFWAHFTAQVLGGLDLFAFLGCDYQAPAPDHAAMRRAWDRMLETLRTDSPAGALERDGLLRQMLSRFVAGADAGQLRRTRQLERFGEVFAFIEARLAGPISLGELAEVAHLQPTYFSNLFSRHMRMPPLRYVSRRRVERAQGLLWQSDAPLKEIARAVGFDDVFYFSRVFRKVAGVSPGRFRRQKTLPVP